MRLSTPFLLASLLLGAALPVLGASRSDFLRSPLRGGALDTALHAERARTLLSLYKEQIKATGMGNLATLEELHARGLAPTAAHAADVRALLASNRAGDEQRLLLKILGQLYRADNPTGSNDAIVTDLRAHAQATDAQVAQAAVLTYSRLAYFPDLLHVLRAALDRRVIGDDVYFGEIAHGMYYAPIEAQNEYLSILNATRNPYAMQILAYLSHDPQRRQRLPPASKQVLLAMLTAAPPPLPPALGEVGLGADLYAWWLHAVASLQSEQANRSYEDIALAYLNDAKTDPRYVMGYLSSADGMAMIHRVGQRAPFASALGRIQLYAKQLPQNQRMRAMVHEVTNAINSVAAS